MPQPIFSRRRRRLIFIPTTWEKFRTAVEINDLYDENPLEDRLWAELKRVAIQAERQERVEIAGRNYFLDFAVYYAAGKIDIETDGDEWHANPEKATTDNLRDNDLESNGWQQLRFNTIGVTQLGAPPSLAAGRQDAGVPWQLRNSYTKQIHEELTAYCVPKIVDTINYLGGVTEEGKLLPRKIDLNGADSAYQLGLFDALGK